ncbi:MAG: hypothetical protein HY696_07205, partial [Deltaproteobacteria bacterium]|nr:hypothetical protein [Deltaproteobacteria bacterium]
MKKIMGEPHVRLHPYLRHWCAHSAARASRPIGAWTAVAQTITGPVVAANPRMDAAARGAALKAVNAWAQRLPSGAALADQAAGLIEWAGFCAGVHGQSWTDFPPLGDRESPLAWAQAALRAQRAAPGRGGRFSAAHDAFWADLVPQLGGLDSPPVARALTAWIRTVPPGTAITPPLIDVAQAVCDQVAAEVAVGAAAGLPRSRLASRAHQVDAITVIAQRGWLIGSACLLGGAAAAALHANARSIISHMLASGDLDYGTTVVAALPTKLTALDAAITALTDPAVQT